MNITDEQIEDEWERITGHSIFGSARAEGRAMYISPDEVTAFARAIEEAHGIANHVPDAGKMVQAQERKPLTDSISWQFKKFREWSSDAGYDTAHTHDGVNWICLNPMTADLWKAWQAAHGIKEQP